MTFDPEKVPAYLRTVVPSLWGMLIAWLLVQIPTIPDDLATWLQSAAVQTVITGLVILVWYAFWRKLEASMSPFWTRVVLGSNLTPSYDAPRVEG